MTLTGVGVPVPDPTVAELLDAAEGRYPDDVRLTGVTFQTQPVYSGDGWTVEWVTYRVEQVH